MLQNIAMRISRISLRFLGALLFVLTAGPALGAESGFQAALRAEQEGQAPPSSGMPHAMPPGPASPGSAGAAAAKEAVQVHKAEGENAFQVAEVFAQAKELAGKTVRVRGRVVKVSRMIMGKNWLHLQDGTGAEGQHDLVVTTTEEARAGEVVTVEGRPAADRDFGMGYRYAVLIEDAKVTR